MARQSRSGEAWLCGDWRGPAWLGSRGQVWHGAARPGEVRRGKAVVAGHGKAGQGWAGRGKAAKAVVGYTMVCGKSTIRKGEA